MSSDEGEKEREQINQISWEGNSNRPELAAPDPHPRVGLSLNLLLGTATTSVATSLHTHSPSSLQKQFLGSGPFTALLTASVPPWHSKAAGVAGRDKQTPFLPG